MKNYDINTPLNVYRPEVTPDLIAQAIKAVRPDSPLINDAASFCDAGQRANVDQVYLAAHAALESAWGTSYYATTRHNLYGYQAYDSNPDAAKTFASDDECIHFIANFVATQYLSPTGEWYSGAPTLSAMNQKYATSTTWAASIATIMNELESQMFGDHQPIIYSLTPFNRNVVVTADQGINVRTDPSVVERNILRTEATGTTLTVEGYTTGDVIDGNGIWYKLKGESAWVWSGATNFVPTITTDQSGIGQNPITPATSPDALQVQIDQLTQDKKDLTAALQQKTKDYSALEKTYQDLITTSSQWKDVATNTQATMTANKALSEQIVAYKEKVSSLTTSLKTAYADAFNSWTLIQFPRGATALPKLILLVLQLTGVFMDSIRHDYVIGWKRDAHIYSSADTTASPIAKA